LRLTPSTTVLIVARKTLTGELLVEQENLAAQIVLGIVKIFGLHGKT
jgi:hypothetical protein